MLSLDRPNSRMTSSGRPLPSVFRSLAARKAFFRRGEYSQIQGVSGSFKSTLAMWHAIQWTDQHKLKGLYFAADSSRLRVMARSVCMLTGQPLTDDLEAKLARFDSGAMEPLRRLQGLQFVMSDEIPLEGIELSVNAFVEKWGEAPDFIFLDNLVDIEQEREGEWEALRQAGKTLSQVAARTGAAAIALHHCADQDYKSTCPPRWAGMGKASIKQRLILSLGRMSGGELPICVVKNNDGPQDPSGQDAIRVKYDPTTLQFEER